MGKELRESRLLAPSGREHVFTQFLTHKFTLLSRDDYEYEYCAIFLIELNFVLLRFQF